VNRAQLLDVLGTLARLGLAAVWLLSGGIKAADPDQTYVAVRAYDVLPPAGVELVAAGTRAVHRLRLFRRGRCGCAR
jgi:hypothetical protein